MVTAFGASNDLALPVNVRFFCGGNSSIRGYASGKAAPPALRAKQFVGAKTYTQLNAEIEQLITVKWSAAIFFNGFGIAT